MISLIGYTGFVGSNIYESAGDEINCLYNSKNIEEAYGTNPDLLIYSGLRAEKYLANNFPEKDMELIVEAENNIKKINPKKLVLISTIDVFKVPKNVDEDSSIDTENLHAYGYNRYELEKRIRKNYPDALIIRLPGLFGKNIKKNFIYDFINVIPFMLKEDKFLELSKKNSELLKYYTLLPNGFYKVEVSEEDKNTLKNIFRNIGFSALNFTDSRSKYQFYNLSHLWGDIKIALEAGLKLWHPATEPVSVSELYEYLTGTTFVNELGIAPADYGYKTLYADLFKSSGDYICDKSEIMQEIKNFIDQQ